MAQQQKKTGGFGGPGSGGNNAGNENKVPDASQVIKKADQNLKVNVVYGAHDLDMDGLAGLTVEEIQLSLRDVLNVDEGAEAYIDGNLVDKGTVLQAGQRLEFMKEAGQKG